MPRTISTGRTPAFHHAVQCALAPLSNPAAASGMRAYMRGQFEYLGIPTPERRATVKLLIRNFEAVTPAALEHAARALWAMPEREYQYVATDLLSRHAGALSVSDLPWLLELAQQKSWWDSVDSLVKVVSKVVRLAGASGRRAMDKAIRTEDFWIRRIAMLHQLGWRGDTDTVRLFRYASLLAPEKEFLIRKAVGWALRDYAWHDWRAVQAFLETSRGSLSPLTVREASKNFPAR